MVILRINGGLGNQMFQYAFGRALSLARGAELAIYIDALQDNALHNVYELERIFEITYHKVNGADFQSVLGWRGARKVRKILMRRYFSWLRGSNFVVEPHYHYWREAHTLPKDCFVVGYWQSEKYFQEIENVIRSDFSFCPSLSSQNTEMDEKIRSCESISLHIRRGDYVSNKKINEVHGSCSLDYYAKAIEFVASRCNNPVLFIFSDDMRWVKKNFKSEIPRFFIDNNLGLESFNDLRLMSSCKHNIIANSSFSWWGAWLNSTADKVVVAPSRWFASARFDSRDLIPDSWIKL